MAQLQYGQPAQWGDDDVLWGFIREIADLSATTIAHWTITGDYPNGAHYAVWTGIGNLTLAGETFVGIGADIISVSGMENTDKNDDQRTSLLITILDDLDKTLFLRDPGVVDIKLQVVYSTNGGDEWFIVPRSIRGRLSNPVLQGNQYQFELATHISDVDRGRPLMWTDETQKARYPGDRGFEHLKFLADGVDIKWPPIPS